MFYPLFLILLLWTVVTAQKHGPRSAIWLCWMTALLMCPTWIMTRYGGLLLDLRTATAVGVLIGFALAGPGQLSASFRQVVLGDVLALFFIGAQILSQFTVGPFTPLTGPEMLRRMLLPYLMGRLCLSSAEDVDRMVPLLAKLCLILSLYAVVEGVSRVHIVNKMLGKSYGLLEQGEGYRMGLKRAQGPVDHPIFFGMMLVMLFPWSIEAMRRARAGRGPRWWIWVPIAMGGGLFVTVSRGAQIAAVFTLFATLWFRRPRWRVVALIAAGLLALLIYANKDLVKDLSETIAGEKTEEPKIIVIDGEEEIYNGTTHRVLLYKVYREAIERVGWLGYGYSLLRVPLDPEYEQRFGSIDNHYLLLLLQHGWLSIVGFLSLGGCSLLYLIRAGWNPRYRQAGVAGAMAGAMAAVLVLLFSVWFSPDFASVWLFNAGLASSLHSLPSKSGLQPTDSQPSQAAVVARPEPLPRALPRPKLTAGHAPIRSLVKTLENA